LIEVSTLFLEHEQDLLAVGDQEVEKGCPGLASISH
jgi:hypothetical protein